MPRHRLDNLPKNISFHNHTGGKQGCISRVQGEVLTIEITFDTVTWKVF